MVRASAQFGNEGKITGDTMKGTAETEWNGNTNKRTFEARRAKE
jgi:hypothetical protein